MIEALNGPLSVAPPPPPPIQSIPAGGEKRRRSKGKRKKQQSQNAERAPDGATVVAEAGSGSGAQAATSGTPATKVSGASSSVSVNYVDEVSESGSKSRIKVPGGGSSRDSSTADLIEEELAKMAVAESLDDLPAAAAGESKSRIEDDTKVENCEDEDITQNETPTDEVLNTAMKIVPSVPGTPTSIVSLRSSQADNSSSSSSSSTQQLLLAQKIQVSGEGRADPGVSEMPPVSASSHRGSIGSVGSAVIVKVHPRRSSQETDQKDSDSALVEDC